MNCDRNVIVVATLKFATRWQRMLASSLSAQNARPPHRSDGSTDKLMRQIKRSYDNKEVTLDDSKVLIVLTNEHPSYKKGTLVYPISGIDGNETPGYHFNKDYMTVCRIGASQAEFCGIKKKNLAVASETEIKIKKA